MVIELAARLLLLDSDDIDDNDDIDEIVVSFDLL